MITEHCIIFQTCEKNKPFILNLLKIKIQVIKDVAEFLKKTNSKM